MLLGEFSNNLRLGYILTQFTFKLFTPPQIIRFSDSTLLVFTREATLRSIVIYSAWFADGLSLLFSP